LAIGFSLLALFGCQSPANQRTNVPAGQSTGLLSTNWVTEAWSALSAGRNVENLSFPEVTNRLAAESRRGNVAAEGLWGFVLVVRSAVPEEAKAGLELLQDSAEKGYVPAMLNLGLLLEAGVFVERKDNEAFHWLGLAAARSNPEAELQVGGCYQYGLGVAQDFAEAAKWYRRSADHTNYVAMKSLGYLLMDGRGVEKDEEAARRWFLRAAEEGNNRRAMYNLGVLSGRKFPDTNGTAEAFRWFQKGAASDDALACLSLANFYFHGWGVVETNLGRYRYWRFRAAVLGATEAQYLMGAAYRMGDGVPQDRQESLAWYEKAAVKNDPMACYDLALMCLEEKTNRASIERANDYMLRAARGGNREAQFQCAMSRFRGDIALDCQGATEWLEKSANSEWPRAEFTLFQLYYYGVAASSNCPPYPNDKTMAVKWLRRAADHGNLKAQATLGVMLLRGGQVEQNKVEAEKWLTDAAQHGYSPAQNDLGYAIFHGDADNTNLVEAAVWCRLAEIGSKDSGVSEHAEVNFSNISSRLTPGQQWDADRRVKDFQPLPVPDPNPMVKDWELAPDYQQEDGRFGH
jgi:hypothetical protein